MDLPKNVINSISNIDKYVNDFTVKLNDANELYSLLLLNNLIIDCRMELTCVKNELGVSHSKYIELSSYLVRFATEHNIELLKFIIKMSSEAGMGIQLLLVEMDDKKLGKTVIDVFNTIFGEIEKIECDNDTKEWFLERKKIIGNMKYLLKPKSGCYIATMAYGDYNHPQVIKLRKFRDLYLSNSSYGRSLINLYYLISPKIVVLLNGNKYANALSRVVLNVFISFVSKRK
jgi:hypothetical protein